jgi:hypothetical protein
MAAMIAKRKTTNPVPSRQKRPAHPDPTRALTVSNLTIRARLPKCSAIASFTIDSP